MVNSPHIGLVLAILLMVACGPASPHADDLASRRPSSPPGGCAEPYDATAPRFAAGPSPRHAERFRVSYHGHYKVVEVEPPGRAGTVERYLLVACGAPRPEGLGETQVFEVPIRSAITTSVTEVSAFSLLDVADRLIGHTTLDHVYAPAIRARIDAGQVAEVGRGGTLDLERIVAALPSVVFADTLGSPELDPSGQLRSLRRAGVPVALVPSYLEPSVLGRAEWVLFVALFLDREHEAAAWFDGVEERYRSLAALGASSSVRPKAITGGPAGDVWHLPGRKSHAASLLTDAGLTLAGPEVDRSGSLALAFEAAYLEALEADWWIHPSLWRSRQDIVAADPRLAAVPAVRDGRVVIHDARTLGAANDYWEQGVVRPDLVLADLLHLVHPELLPDHALVFHRALGADEEVGAR